MRIIPAIDIIDGQCVRLSQGDFNQKKVYNSNPLEVAQDFESKGIEYLHLVDLDGAKKGEVVNLNILKEIAQSTDLTIDFGGGIQRLEDVEKIIEAGASQVTIGSLAVKKPELLIQWGEKVGQEKLIIAADCKEGNVLQKGWKEGSAWSILDFIQQYEQEGFLNIMTTDVSKDGMLQGPSIGLYKSILQKTTVNLIASGGVRNLEDLNTLKTLGCEGAIVGKAIYEGTLKLEEIC